MQHTFRSFRFITGWEDLSELESGLTIEAWLAQGSVTLLLLLPSASKKQWQRWHQYVDLWEYVWKLRKRGERLFLRWWRTSVILDNWQLHAPTQLFHVGGVQQSLLSDDKTCLSQWEGSLPGWPCPHHWSFPTSRHQMREEWYPSLQ